MAWKQGKGRVGGRWPFPTIGFLLHMPLKGPTMWRNKHTTSLCPFKTFTNKEAEPRPVGLGSGQMDHPTAEVFLGQQNLNLPLFFS